MATAAGNQKVVASLALHGMVLPALDELQQEQYKEAARILRDAFITIESQIPGITHQFLNGVIESGSYKTDLNFEQSMLRNAATPCKEYQLDRPEKEFTRLSNKSSALKLILCKIPDDIGNRSKFLNTIKNIAAAIKEMLDTLNDVCKRHKDFKKLLETQKKEFIQQSKNFSDTLKRYFKDENADAVFESANRLINYTNAILRTIRMASNK